jgi:glucokinase
MTEMLSRTTGGARPPATAAPVVALDVGATRIKGAVVTASGERLVSVRHSTGRGDGPDVVLRRVADVAGELAADAGRISAAGVAVCGAVGPGGTVTSVNLSWAGVGVGAAIGERLGVPVTVLNDAHAGALGEGAVGAARDAGDYLYVSLGTGIGAAIVNDGRVRAGAHGYGGELGHIRVDYPGRRCACGSHGCLETVMSAAALEARWVEAYGGMLPARDIIDRVIAGDPDASGLWDRAVDGLAAGLLTAMSLVDPAVIVLGGGLARVGARLTEPLSRSIAARSAPFHTAVELRLATLGDWSGCHGAATQARGLPATQAPGLPDAQA